MRGMGFALLIAALLAAALLAWMLPRFDGAHRSAVAPAARFDLAALIGADIRGPGQAAPAAADYARALGPRPLSFPRDHGPHPEYRSEWWYFTGNLSAADGRRFGYQWVLFRLALAPDASAAAPGSGPDTASPRRSAWRANQAYMAHFALTDAAAGGFHAFERFARGAAGLAGAAADPLHLWLDDWSLTEDPAGGVWRLRARADGIDIDLELRATRAPVPQGEGGFSRKSAAAGNASYYYSISRLDSRGILRAGEHSHVVEGLSWLDREWGTSALAEDQQGWDWFALQLDDGTDLMVYRLRRKDGGIDPFSAGMLVTPNDSRLPLAADDVSLDILDTWTSPEGVRYPAGWRLRLPGRDLVLDVRPLIPDQELDLSVRYWEGAVTVTGRHAGAAVGGSGYVELVGYADAEAESPEQ